MDASSARTAPAAGMDRAVSRLRPALGTFVAVEAHADDARTAERGIEAAYQAIALVDTWMHPRREGSDLTALQRCAPGETLTVQAWTWEVLAMCRDLNRDSHGTFDPCLPDSAARMPDIELAEPQRVTPQARLSIDLGGIAKGFAVDRALDALRAAGCHGGLVNAGGDLAVFGARSYDILCCDVRVALLNAALATSDAGGDDSDIVQARPPEHRGYYDGSARATWARSRRRAVPISGRVSVMAPTAAIADALTKCLIIGERPWTAALLERYGARRVGT